MVGMLHAPDRAGPGAWPLWPPPGPAIAGLTYQVARHGIASGVEHLCEADHKFFLLAGSEQQFKHAEVYPATSQVLQQLAATGAVSIIADVVGD